MLAPIEARVTSSMSGGREDPAPDAPAIGPEFWPVLRDALEGNPKALEAFGAGGTVDGVFATLCDRGLSAERARDIGQALRQIAFEAEHGGEAAVRLTSHDSLDAPAQPGLLVTVATALDVLAALAGSSSVISFRRRVPDDV